MKVWCAITAVALCATLTSCSSGSHAVSHTASRDASTRSSKPTASTVHHSTSSASDPRPVAANSVSNDGGKFCGEARALGLEQISFGDSSAMEATVLPKLDVLAAEAPSEIASDFRFFVTIEHAVLGGGTPDPAVLQKIDSPDTASRLSHVYRYLADTCGTN